LKQSRIVETHGRVNVYDDLTLRIDRFDATDVSNVLLDLRVYIVGWCAQYEGEFRNNAELFRAFGKLQDRVRVLRSALVHLREDFIGAGLRAKEDHLAAAVAHATPGGIGELHQCVRPGFTPPCDAAATQPFSDLTCSILGHKEVVVDEFHSIDAVLIAKPEY